MSLNSIFSKEQREILTKSDNILELTETVTIKEDGLNYIRDAGNYKVNEGDKRYLQKINVK